MVTPARRARPRAAVPDPRGLPRALVTPPASTRRTSIGSRTGSSRRHVVDGGRLRALLLELWQRTRMDWGFVTDRLATTFRKETWIGAHERRFVGETLYGLVRHLRRIDAALERGRKTTQAAARSRAPARAARAREAARARARGAARARSRLERGRDDRRRDRRASASRRRGSRSPRRCPTGSPRGSSPTGATRPSRSRSRSTSARR